MPPHTPANLEAKHQRQEQLNYQQQQQEKIDRQQAKLERRQKQQDYKQMYQNQFDYQVQMDEKRAKRQLRSQPVYIPQTQSALSSETISSSTTIDTSEAWSSQVIPPNNEMYYYASRYQQYQQRERPSYYYRDNQHHSTSTSPSQQSRLDSISSTSSSASSSQKTKVSAEQMRSLSLKTQSAKSMYDLRPWYGSPQSPDAEHLQHFHNHQHHRDFESDDTLSQGWDPLTDNLYSPTMPAPLDAANWEATSREDPETEQIEASLEILTLGTGDSKNGKGKYLLGKIHSNLFRVLCGSHLPFFQTIKMVLHSFPKSPFGVGDESRRLAHPIGSTTSPSLVGKQEEGWLGLWRSTQFCLVLV